MATQSAAAAAAATLATIASTGLLPPARSHPADIPVYLKCDLSEQSLRVHIAGLVEATPYVARVQLTRGADVVLNEARAVLLAPGRKVALCECSVVGGADSLKIEVYDASKTLLAVVKRQVAVGAEYAALSKKRCRDEPESTTPKTAKKPANRQSHVIKCIRDSPSATERTILEQCGDNRYTREILRRLIVLESVQRLGKGGANDPFRYEFVRSPEESMRDGKEDPAVNIRMQRIEKKIMAALDERKDYITEKEIRATVGDNTGTGRALRNLVKTSRVHRAGKGGAGDPFTYQASKGHSDYHALSDCSTIPSNTPSVADADEFHSDEEVQVAHTLALLARGCSPVAPTSQKARLAAAHADNKIAHDRWLDTCIAAAAALDAQA